MAHIRKIADLKNITATEQRLIKDCKAGEVCSLGELPEEGDKSREIRADLLRFLILGGCDDCAISEGVTLAGAVITGELDLDFKQSKGPIAFVFCRFQSDMTMMQAQCDTLNLQGSHLKALNAQGIKVEGGVFLRSGFHANGEVNLSGAEIGGQLDCDNGRFSNKGDHALNAQGIKVEGDIFLRKGFHSTGKVRLSGAEIGGQLNCDNGRFSNKGDQALNAHSIKVKGGVFFRAGFQAIGEISLSGAEIGGQLSCSNGRFSNNRGYALNTQSIKVKGGVFLRAGFQALGEVSLSGAEIGGQLSCINGRFSNADGHALQAQRMLVTEGFLWWNVDTPEGSIALNGAKVGGLADDLPSWPTGERVYLDGFDYAHIAGSSTDAASRLDWLSRGDTWKGKFFPQPYVHLAKVLREMGHERDARKVLFRLNVLRRQHMRSRARVSPDGSIRQGFVSLLGDISNLGRWVWDFIQRYSIGYGLKPMRSLLVLGMLFLIATTLADFTWREGSFAPNSGPIITSQKWQEVATNTTIANPAEYWSDKGRPGQDWESFSRYAYGADVVIPIIDFGQTNAWAPSTERGWWGKQLWWARWVLSVLGWIVTALAAAAVTGIIKRE